MLKCLKNVFFYPVKNVTFWQNVFQEGYSAGISSKLKVPDLEISKI
jgi:hypothetical protein